MCKIAHEATGMSVGDSAGSSGRAAAALNYQASSPAPHLTCSFRISFAETPKLAIRSLGPSLI